MGSEELDDLLDDYFKDVPTPEELKRKKQVEARAAIEQEQALRKIRNQKLAESIEEKTHASQLWLTKAQTNDLQTFLKNSETSWLKSGNPLDDIQRLIRQVGPAGVNLEGALRPAFIELALLEKLQRNYPLAHCRASFKQYSHMKEIPGDNHLLHAETSIPSQYITTNDWDYLDGRLNALQQDIFTQIERNTPKETKHVIVYGNHAYTIGGHIHVNLYYDTKGHNTVGVPMMIQAWVVYDFRREFNVPAGVTRPNVFEPNRPKKRQMDFGVPGATTVFDNTGSF